MCNFEELAAEPLLPTKTADFFTIFLAKLDFRYRTIFLIFFGKNRSFFVSSIAILTTNYLLCHKHSIACNYIIFRIKGRDVHFDKSCGGVLFSTFQELCARPLWTNDYLKLTQVLLLQYNHQKTPCLELLLILYLDII